MANNGLSNLILSLFRGRTDCVAVQGAGSSFHPERLSSPIDPNRLESQHLSQGQCLGFYLLDEHSKCFCACADFDNKPERSDPQWKSKVEQLYFALMQRGIKSVVELSQSGSGAHVWIFFNEPTDAWIPRAFLKALANKIDLNLSEIYPRQDAHVASSKTLGNLVRYPLFNLSTFVDVESEWTPCDPVETLSSVQKLCGADLKLIAFQSGLGELVSDPLVHLALIDVGEKKIFVSSRVRKLIEESSTLLGRRWRNDPTGMADRSRSAVAMSLCCEFVRSYVPTPEISNALRAWCCEHVPDGKYDRDKWVNDTVTKAYDFVTQKVEAKSVAATTFRDAAHAYVDLIENNRRVWVPSGIKELDESIDGAAPGEVVIIAGRPGHGKSAVGIQWLANAAKMGVSCLMISEEMGIVEIGKRRLMTVTSIPQDQWVSAHAATLRKDIDAAHRKSADVYLVENCNSIDRCEAVIEQFSTLYNVGLVAIDYLQLLGAKNTERYEVVTECSRRIKQSARRNNIAILLLSQLNRQVEGRDDNEPKMSDLRESGQIEQDADLILFAQYPCRFDASMSPDVYRLIAGKRRNGPIRNPRMELKFNPHRQIIGMPDLPDEILDL